MPEKTPLLPPACFLLALLCSAALHHFVPVTPLIQGSLRWVGFVPVVLGFWVAVRASRQFALRATAIRPYETSSVLVTDGWFRFSRNPMYLSMLVILFGIATMLGSASAFVPIPILGIFLHYRFVCIEESMLLETFQDEYRDYCCKVRRWL